LHPGDSRVSEPETEDAVRQTTGAGALHGGLRADHAAVAARRVLPRVRCVLRRGPRARPLV